MIETLRVVMRIRAGQLAVSEMIREMPAYHALLVKRANIPLGVQRSHHALHIDE